MVESATFPLLRRRNQALSGGRWIANEIYMSVESPHILHREVTDRIIRGFYDTYNELGPGFPEFVCLAALAITLRDMGLRARTEVEVPVWFRGQRIGKFRPDLIAEEVVIVEVKAQQQFERFT
ncbi:MAG: GxxExxY protein [Vicinamibacterales bacterium]